MLWGATATLFRDIEYASQRLQGEFIRYLRMNRNQLHTTDEAAFNQALQCYQEAEAKMKEASRLFDVARSQQERREREQKLQQDKERETKKAPVSGRWTDHGWATKDDK